jgi:F-box and WD-40 domain protein CDC4
MCTAILQGHTSLVGQLQMKGSTLVTGGSDGSVRVWSLNTYSPLHRLAAHDNSVTSLQFDDTRIVSGGSDGRVKIWDLHTGNLIRELSQPAEAVWRVAFEEERSVVLASRQGRTVMEVWDFSPPDEDREQYRPLSGVQPSRLSASGSTVEDAVMEDIIDTITGSSSSQQERRRSNRKSRDLSIATSSVSQQQPANEENNAEMQDTE